MPISFSYYKVYSNINDKNVKISQSKWCIIEYNHNPHDKDF